MLIVSRQMGLQATGKLSEARMWMHLQVRVFSERLYPDHAHSDSSYGGRGDQLCYNGQ